MALPTPVFFDVMYHYTPQANVSIIKWLGLRTETRVGLDDITGMYLTPAIFLSPDPDYPTDIVYSFDYDEAPGTVFKVDTKGIPFYPEHLDMVFSEYGTPGPSWFCMVDIPPEKLEVSMVLPRDLGRVVPRVMGRVIGRDTIG